MKQSFVIFIIYFFLGQSINGQKIDTVYIDENGGISDSGNYTFYRLFTQIGDVIKVTDYYKNGEIQMTGGYKDKEFSLPTGPFYYYDRRNRNTYLAVYEPHLYPYIQAHINKAGSFITTETDSLILYCYYHQNGKIKSIGYRSDLCTLQGTWRYFDKKGRIKYKIAYDHNVPEGEYIYYNYNGMPFVIGNFIDGKRVGEFEQFHVDGTHWRTIYYIDGKRTAVIH